MKGVILAGGKGTRLSPLTDVVNKHLLPVYNKPMIHYPINTLCSMGCNEIIIITGGEHIGAFAEYLKDGSDFGVKITYRVQTESGGIAQALGCVEGLTTGLFPVILGDNYLSTTPLMPDEPTLYVSKVSDPERFGVYYKGHIEEKPLHPKSKYVVTGFYIYDDRVYEAIKQLVSSARGELEITDINNFYLDNDCAVKRYEGYWSDMGTFDSLMEVSKWQQK